MTKRSVARVGMVAIVLYGVTWCVAAATLKGQLGAAWMVYAARSFQGVGPTNDRPDPLREATGHDIDVDVNAVVPVLPAVVLVNSELSGTFNPGGVSRFTVGSWSLVAVYGVGARILKAWPLYVAP